MVTEKENSNVQCNHITIDIKLPQFRNEEVDNPLMFLNEIKNYCKIKDIPEHRILLMIGLMLKDKAKIWFEANQGVLESFEDFEIKFKEEFFSIEHQIELRNKWVNRKYKQADGSLKTHFLKAKTEAQYIMTNNSE